MNAQTEWDETRGKDAVGRVNIRIEYMGKTYSGRAMDTDIIKASALAFLNGINAAVLDLVAVG
ncbi:LeuA allosteric domain-containing protein [Brevibacillus sp. CF112]|nr:LeuA allosteric domain-containing protein [Brevibacillus sp. CF112]QHZ57777.1 2-isopropylmalate synthase [Brevibacillus sp. NSP2.1]